ncbi:MAG: uroporphyrinogen-III synthase [Polyangiales bacterium]
MSNERALTGQRVAVFETRLGPELANLLRKHGAEPLVGPTMVEAPLTLGPELESFAAALRAGEIDVLLVLTGVGNRKLVTLLEPIMPRDELRDRLAGIVVAARGPKAVLALRELGVKPSVVAPEPHTWEDLLRAVAAHTRLSGARVALQQYGVPHGRLTQALEGEGATVVQVPVYRWRLPDDTGPLHQVITEICAGRVDAILFTSGPQAGVLIDVAKERGDEAALRAALGRVGIGSIGPTCTEALGELAIVPDFEPAHGKMGHLVLEASRKLPEVLARKRGFNQGPS